VSDLDDKLERVNDRDSFLDFVQALVEDRVHKAKEEHRFPHGGQPDGWENSKLEDYLAAVLAAVLAWALASRTLPNGLASERRGAASPIPVLRQDLRVTTRPRLIRASSLNE
jgi:hypothetical protein